MESNHLLGIKPMHKPKRFRSAFTTEQINFLELQFKKFPYINSEHRAEIAHALKLQERAIKIWFQNRRMKEKKEICMKECDGEMNNVESLSEDRLHNAYPLPSANEQLSLSSPVLIKSTTNKYTSPGKTILDDVVSVQKDNNKQIRPKSHHIQQKHSTNQAQHVVGAKQNLSFQYKLPTASFLNTDQLYQSVEHIQSKNIVPSSKSKKFTTCSTDVGRKAKKESYHSNIDHQTKTKKLESGHHTSAAKLRTAPVDLSSKKKRLAPIPPKPPKQVNIGNSTYYPVMPTVYAHPFMSSGGMILKPFNVLPVISPGAAITVQNNPQASCCSCNCHGSTQPFTVPPNPIGQYTQYVITPSFQNQRP